MRKVLFLLSIILLIFSCIFLSGCGAKNAPSPADNKFTGKATNMKLTSPVFDDGDFIPAKYTCDGENVSPPLEISDVPEDTQSLVLIVDDPDAPAGDWVHWTIWNIDPGTKEISEGNVPAGAMQGSTDFGNNKYGGPFPPSGTHRYQFKLYALDTILDLNSYSAKKDIEREMKDHILDQIMFVGLYQKR